MIWSNEKLPWKLVWHVIERYVGLMEMDSLSVCALLKCFTSWLMALEWTYLHLLCQHVKLNQNLNTKLSNGYPVTICLF